LLVARGRAIGAQHQQWTTTATEKGISKIRSLASIGCRSRLSSKVATSAAVGLSTCMAESLTWGIWPIRTASGRRGPRGGCFVHVPAAQAGGLVGPDA